MGLQPSLLRNSASSANIKDRQSHVRWLLDSKRELKALTVAARILAFSPAWLRLVQLPDVLERLKQPAAASVALNGAVRVCDQFPAVLGDCLCKATELLAVMRPEANPREAVRPSR